MKIAVLSDIHGNEVALEAVLAEVSGLGIEQLFVLGDFVGYYYNPDKVLDQLAPFQTTMVRGNHEMMMERSQTDEQEKTRVQQKYGSGVIEALKKLSEDRIEQLLALPETKKVTVDGVSFLLCHGSPWDNNEYIYPDADQSILQKCASENVDFVLMGHTHRPFVYSFKGSTVLNPGSVGQPRDVGNLASWAIIDTSNKSVIPMRTLFDTAPVIEEARRTDPDVPYLTNVLTRKKL